MEVTETRFGCQSMTAKLRRVLLRRPPPAELARWREFGWRAAPDPLGFAAEHDALCEILEDAGAGVIVAEPLPGCGLDALYAYDPALVSDEGAVLLRPGKEARRAEPGTIATDLQTAGVEVLVYRGQEISRKGDGGPTCLTRPMSRS